MHFLSALAAALSLGAAHAAVMPSAMSLHEKRSDMPTSWSKRFAAPRDLVVPVRIGITPRNFEQGHDMIMDIADPASANFGKLWSAQRVEDFFAPTKETVADVTGWLTGAGIDDSRLKVHGGRGQVKFYATIEELEALLGATYHVYEQVDTGDLTVSADEYHVPAAIQGHIDFVSPTTGFVANSIPGLKKMQKRATPGHPNPLIKFLEGPPIDADSASNCSGIVTPACIKALYGLPVNTVDVAGNDLGIFESGDM